MTTWSHSRLERFENCPRSYWYTYVEKPDKADVLPPGIEGVMGTAVHATVERIYHHVARTGKQPSIEQARKHFRPLFAEACASGVHIARKGKAEADYRAIGERCLENLWAMEAPFDASTTIGLEVEVRGEIAGELFRGYIDRLFWRGDTLVIRDYKTSAKAKSWDQIEDDTQLSSYEILVRRKLGHTGPVEHSWSFLQPGVERTRMGSEEVRRQAELRTQETADDIRAVLKLGGGAFSGMPSPLCGWCQFQRICPEAKR